MKPTTNIHVSNGDRRTGHAFVYELTTAMDYAIFVSVITSLEFKQLLERIYAEDFVTTEQGLYSLKGTIFYNVVITYAVRYADVEHILSFISDKCDEAKLNLARQKQFID